MSIMPQSCDGCYHHKNSSEESLENCRKCMYFDHYITAEDRQHFKDYQNELRAIEKDLYKKYFGK